MRAINTVTGYYQNIVYLFTGLNIERVISKVRVIYQIQKLGSLKAIFKFT